MKRWQIQSLILAFAIVLPHLDAAQSSDVLDIYFVLSDSVCGNGDAPICPRWSSVLQFVIDFVNASNIGPSATRIGLVSSASTAASQWNLNSYSKKTDLINAIRNLPYPNGETNLAGALHTVRTMGIGDRPNTDESAIVILTDGRLNDPRSVRAEIDLARPGEIKIFFVGFYPDVDDGTLKMLSSYPHKLNQNYFMVFEFVSLGDVVQALRASLGLKFQATTPTPTAD